MNKDSVLREVWKAKDDLAAKFNYDVNAMFRDLQARQAVSRRKYVYPKPRKRSPAPASPRVH